MTAPSRPATPPAQPTDNRITTRIELAVFFGYLLAVVGVVVGIVIGADRREVACPNGTVIPAGQDDVHCHTYPFATAGISVAVLALLLGIVIGLTGWTARSLVGTANAPSARSKSAPSARRTSTTSIQQRKDSDMETINLGGPEGMPPIDWAGIEDTIAAGTAPAPGSVNCRTTWLTTINDDGTPHVAPVGAIWLAGAFWFQTGATRKGRNVARNPRCWLSLSIAGADVVIEGVAMHVTDRGEIARAAQAWADTGWPAELHESGTGITAPFNAPAQGPAPWNVYRVDARSATVVSTVEPGGLTRFRF